VIPILIRIGEATVKKPADNPKVVQRGFWTILACLPLLAFPPLGEATAPLKSNRTIVKPVAPEMLLAVADTTCEDQSETDGCSSTNDDDGKRKSGGTYYYEYTYSPGTWTNTTPCKDLEDEADPCHEWGYVVCTVRVKVAANGVESVVSEKCVNQDSEWAGD